MKHFDVIVLGGGPGGYVAAIRASQNGKSVALIEARELGGTCLNCGCIPSKALLSGAELLHRIKQADDFGISVGPISVNYSKMVERKNRIVSRLVKGLNGLMQANQITLLRGFGKFVAPKEIKVIGQDNEILSADQIIIATGSEPLDVPQFPFDHQKVLSSTSVLDLQTLPKSIAIIGGGFIGCEFASLFQELGVQVTIIEMFPEIIPHEGKEMSKALSDSFRSKGIQLRCNTKVADIDTEGEGVTIALEGGDSLHAEIALVAVGRRLNTTGIGLEHTGIALTARGAIPVDEKMETPVSGIYAVGDITAKWLLAHVASHQGIVAATNATGGHAAIDYNAIPSVVYTNPEIATVGLSLEKALAQGYEAVLGKFPFQALGKAQAALQTEGFAQLVVEKKTGRILGAQVVGHEASSLIASMTLAIQNELTVESIESTIHAHPSLPEAWLEASLLAVDMPMHMPPKIKAIR